MISNITYKSAACAQLYMYEQLQGFAQTHPHVAVPMAAFVSVADVATETFKHSIAVIENVAFSVINIGGSPCVSKYQNNRNHVGRNSSHVDCITF